MTITRQLRITYSGEQADLEVVLPNGATIATLIDLLGATTTDLMVSGRLTQPWMSLEEAGVWDGVTIDLDQIPGADIASSTAVVSLDQIAGSGPRVSIPLAAGTHEFDANSGPYLAGSEFALTVTPDGHVTVFPRRGPLVIDNALIDVPTALGDQVLTIGGSRFSVGAPPREVDLPVDVTPAERSKRVPPGRERTVTPGVLPTATKSDARVSWLAFVPVCVIFGLLGAIAHPLFFIGAGVALVASFGLLLNERRRRLSDAETLRSQQSSVVTNFRHDVVRQRRDASAALRRHDPSIPDLVRDARTGASGFWQRQLTDADFGEIVVGYGELPWKVSVDSAFAPDPALQGIVDRNDRLTSVPIHIDLTDGPLGLVGPRERTLPAARAIVATACSQWDTDALRVAVACEDTSLDSWQWLKWAPHFDRDRRVATSIDAVDRMVSSWRTPGHSWLQLVIADQPKWAEPDVSLLYTVAGEPGRQSLLCLADTASELPDCAAVVTFHSDGTVEVARRNAEPVDFVGPRFATASAAESIVRGAAWRQRSNRGADESGAHGVRPFQLQDASAEELDEAGLRPPPVPEGPNEPSESTQSASAPAEVIPSTVIRAAATNSGHDGAALTPPNVPDPDQIVAVTDLRDDVIDLTDSPVSDEASDAPGTRWTRRHR
jgi:hypothetical protein